MAQAIALDRLRSNLEERLRYETLKRRLAKEDWPDMDAYARAKTDVVEEITARALIATTPNFPPFLYTDFTGDTGRAQYIYRVCEAGTQTCSNDIRVRFPE